jgi:hypothetical protein
MTFTDMEYAGRKRCGKREKFLESMDGVIPWAAFIEAIEPFYPKSGATARQGSGKSCAFFWDFFWWVGGL